MHKVNIRINYSVLSAVFILLPFPKISKIVEIRHRVYHFILSNNVKKYTSFAGYKFHLDSPKKKKFHFLNRKTIIIQNKYLYITSSLNNSQNFSTMKNAEHELILLDDIIKYKNKTISSWIIESKVKKLCKFYNSLTKTHKIEFIQALVENYNINHKKIIELSQVLAEYSTLPAAAVKTEIKILKSEEQLKNLLMPDYLWLFLQIGKVEKGVKFLVDTRSDVLELIAEKSLANENIVGLQQLNTVLKEILSLWFSVGFLHLQRITWKSSCEMLQKISEYEAVHPIKNWTDLKKRVGLYKRCFVFLHGSMPGEPIVVLHTALCDKIVNSLYEIVAIESKISVNHDSCNNQNLLNFPEEDPKYIKAAVFYSISSTQKGLKGIELGNYLIKSVIQELQIEFPQIIQFSSLSPIPNFRKWLIEKLKFGEKGPNDVFFEDEIELLKNCLNTSDFWKKLRKTILENTWYNNKDLVFLLEKPLMRLCARYLFLEKHRGYAYDNVANFHLKNGAVMWRLNWCANPSLKGLSSSCGIMVNYRYFLNNTEANSTAYLENFHISASDQVLKLSEQAQHLFKPELIKF